MNVNDYTVYNMYYKLIKIIDKPSYNFVSIHYNQWIEDFLFNVHKALQTHYSRKAIPIFLFVNGKYTLPPFCFIIDPWKIEQNLLHKNNKQMYSVKKISCFYQLIQIRSNILIVSVTNKCTHIYKTHKILRYKKIIIMLFKLDGELGICIALHQMLHVF